MKHPRHNESSQPPSSPAEDNDAVWTLLAKCPPAKASPWFVSKTLHRLRMESGRRRPHFWSLWAAACAAVAILAGLLAFPLHPLSPRPQLSEESQSTELLREELHLMTYVDELLAVSDPATLDDVGLAELF